MAEGGGSRGTFAMTFSDLMMGAMVIVIVLLLFLSVVIVRGQGTGPREAHTVYPPGLRESLGVAAARIRLTVEPAAAMASLAVDNVNGAAQEVGGKGRLASGDLVAIREIFLPEGLGSRTVRVRSRERLTRGVSVSVSVLVGGLRPPPLETWTSTASVPGGTELFTIQLSSEKIVELPR